MNAENLASTMKKTARILGKPGLLAWSLVFGLLLLGSALPREAISGPVVAALLSSGILLLATGRAWGGRRQVAEVLSIAVVLSATSAAMTHVPSIWQIGLTPVVMIFVVLAVLAGFEWLFAPDVGQAGIYWNLLEATHRTLWIGFGIAAAIVIVASGPHDNPWHHSLAYTLCAFGGYGAGCVFVPARSVNDRVALVFERNDARMNQKQESDPADWWKGH